MDVPEPVLTRFLNRVRGEYLEMPGLKLTVSQAQRLWSMDRPMCERLLTSLVRSNFLTRTRDGAFILAV